MTTREELLEKVSAAEAAMTVAERRWAAELSVGGSAAAAPAVKEAEDRWKEAARAFREFETRGTGERRVYPVPRAAVAYFMEAVRFANPGAKVELASWDEECVDGAFGYDHRTLPVAVEIETPQPTPAGRQ